MVKIKNGQVSTVGLPETGILSDGRTVSNYNKLSEDILLTEGWLPLFKQEPEYSPDTQYLDHGYYEILEDKVIQHMIVCTIQN